MEITKSDRDFQGIRWVCKAVAKKEVRKELNFLYIKGKKFIGSNGIFARSYLSEGKYEEGIHKIASLSASKIILLEDYTVKNAGIIEKVEEFLNIDESKTQKIGELVGFTEREMKEGFLEDGYDFHIYAPEILERFKELHEGKRVINIFHLQQTLLVRGVTFKIYANPKHVMIYLMNDRYKALITTTKNRFADEDNKEKEEVIEEQSKNPTTGEITTFKNKEAEEVIEEDSEVQVDSEKIEIVDTTDYNDGEEEGNTMSEDKNKLEPLVFDEKKLEELIDREVSFQTFVEVLNIKSEDVLRFRKKVQAVHYRKCVDNDEVYKIEGLRVPIKPTNGSNGPLKLHQKGGIIIGSNRIKDKIKEWHLAPGKTTFNLKFEDKKIILEVQ